MPADQVSGVERAESRRLVSRLLAELGSPCRELMARVYFAEEPYAAIARDLGKSEAAVKVQVHRCRRQAGEILKAWQAGSLVTSDRPPSPNQSNLPLPAGGAALDHDS